jgi:hypothetical protein
MCWPAAEEPFEAFSKALTQFENEVNDILIYNMPMKQKYIKVHSSETGSRKLSIYCQRGTDLIVKIIVSDDISQSQHGKDAVSVYSDDVDVLLKITSLDSYAVMQEKMKEIRDIVYADQVAVKLTYGF